MRALWPSQSDTNNPRSQRSITGIRIHCFPSRTGPPATVHVANPRRRRPRPPRHSHLSRQGLTVPQPAVSRINVAALRPARDHPAAPPAVTANPSRAARPARSNSPPTSASRSANATRSTAPNGKRSTTSAASSSANGPKENKATAFAVTRSTSSGSQPANFSPRWATPPPTPPATRAYAAITPEYDAPTLAEPKLWHPDRPKVGRPRLRNVA